MKTSFLLPNSYKRIGIILFSIGLIIWIVTQRGVFNSQLNHTTKVVTLTISFFSFLIGLYFITFSKEIVEDEFINSIRLKSFQISSLIQMVFFLISFTLMFIFNFEPNGDSGLSTFLLFSIILFWIMYLIFFNYILLSNKSKINE